MPTFVFVREDCYEVEVEAKDRREAWRKTRTDDNLLNGGSFCESKFKFSEERK